MTMLALLASGSAGASSFVTPGPVETSRSIIYLGEPEARESASARSRPQPPSGAATPGGDAASGAGFVMLSPSVIAFGEPAVETGQVASIDRDKRRRNPHSLPLVIRGGIYGEAYTRAGQEQPAPPQQATAAPEAPPSDAQPQTPEPQQPEPEPVLPPPAAPTGRPE